MRDLSVVLLGKTNAGKDYWLQNQTLVTDPYNIKFANVAKDWMKSMGYEVEDKQQRKEDIPGFPFNALDVLQAMYLLKQVDPTIEARWIKYTIDKIPVDCTPVFTDVRTENELMSVIVFSEKTNRTLIAPKLDVGNVMDNHYTDKELPSLYDMLTEYFDNLIES